MVGKFENISESRCSLCFDSKILFETLTELEETELKANSVTIKFKKGEVICKQGTYASNIIYLKEGLAKIFLEFNDKNIILRVEPAGQLLALQSLYGNMYRYTSVAYEDTIVNLIDINFFRKLMFQNATFSYHIANAANDSTISAFDRVICLTQKKSHGRIAEVLICLYERIYKELKFKLHFPRKDLAELSNMSVENLTRTLNDFRNDNILKIKGNNIEILNLEQLKTISKKG